MFKKTFCSIRLNATTWTTTQLHKISAITQLRYWCVVNTFSLAITNNEIMRKCNLIATVATYPNVTIKMCSSSIDLCTLHFRILLWSSKTVLGITILNNTKYFVSYQLSISHTFWKEVKNNDFSGARFRSDVQNVNNTTEIRDVFSYCTEFHFVLLLLFYYHVTTKLTAYWLDAG